MFDGMFMLNGINPVNTKPLFAVCLTPAHQTPPNRHVWVAEKPGGCRFPVAGVVLAFGQRLYKG